MIRWKKSLQFAAAAFVVGYVGIAGWYRLKEDSFVYNPTHTLRNADSLRLGIERVELTTPDSVKLVGWIVPPAVTDSSHFWLLYLHGKGGNVSSRVSIGHYRGLRNLGVTTFAVDYRGYGQSSGTPSESGLYTDAEAAFSYLVNVRHVPASHIVIAGFSLGTGVATELAGKVDAAGLILEGAFTSLPDIGQRMYPYLPVKLIMKNRFASMERIEAIREPILFLHASKDEVVPLDEARGMFVRAHEPKSFIETKGGHESAFSADSAVFFSGIMKFLETLKRSH